LATIYLVSVVSNEITEKNLVVSFLLNISAQMQLYATQFWPVDLKPIGGVDW
jgi:hypothetical protein